MVSALRAPASGAVACFGRSRRPRRISPDRVPLLCPRSPDCDDFYNTCATGTRGGGERGSELREGEPGWVERDAGEGQ
jgi:hypothetical protein